MVGRLVNITARIESYAVGVLFGEVERGLTILGKSMELNHHYPGWLHIDLPPF